MVTDSAKTIALVISAIKNLREVKGSTTREILHYLSSVYDIPTQVARRQMQTALRRGVAYGILKKNGGSYVLPINRDTKGEEIASQEINLLDFCRKKRSRKLACKCKKRRRSRRRRRRKKSCKCKKKRRRRRSRGCKRRMRRRSRGCKRRRRRRSSIKCRRRKKRKCRCGGLGNKRVRHRMRSADALQTNTKVTNEKFYEPQFEANDSGPSECSSVSSIVSTVD